MTAAAASTGPTLRSADAADEPAGATGLATASLVLGAVALVLDVLLVPTILAIAFGAVALARGTAGRTRAVLGIVLGSAGVLALIAEAAVLLPLVGPLVVARAQDAVGDRRMATSITEGFADRGVTVRDVRCPLVRDVDTGTTTTCTATTAAGEPIHIDVFFTDRARDFTFALNAG